MKSPEVARTARPRSLNWVLVDTTALRQFPEFRRLWIGLSLSQVGAQLGVVAVAYQVYRVTGSVFDVGLASLIQLGPTFVAAILGGSLADSANRRTLLVCTELTIGLGSAGLALNSSGGKGSLWTLYLLAAAVAAATGIDGPTRTAMMLTIVDKESFISANAVRQLTQRMSTVIGPSVGGILLGSFGVTAVFWVNSAVVFIALSTVLTVKAPPRADEASRFGVQSILEGFAYFKGRQALQGCFAADLNAMVLGMPSALFPALGIDRFHGGARVVGLLFAAPGIGAVVASIVSGWSRNVRRPGYAVCVAIGIWGAAIAAFGLCDSLALAVVLLAIAGMADVTSVLFLSTIIQTETPDRLRGRISSIQMGILSNGPRLGNMEAGTVASIWGLQTSVVSGGVGCIVGIALIARLMPRFVRYEMSSSRRPTSATPLEPPLAPEAI